MLITAPSFVFFSENGPGSMYAPWLLALVAGLIVSCLAQKTRLCMVGGLKDVILFKDYYLLSGFISILVVALIGNLLITKSFTIGFTNQPVAHMDGVWNFLGMLLAGWSSVLLGGCPLRQLILSGEGNTDSVITVMGLIMGTAFAHNFSLASSPKGPTPNGQIAVILGFVVLLGVPYFNIKKIGVKMKGYVKLEA